MQIRQGGSWRTAPCSFVLLVLLAAGAPMPAPAQEDRPQAEAEGAATADSEGDASAESFYYDVTVTATRWEEDTFAVPQPVSVIGAERLAESPAPTATDFLRELPGVDVNGVGANQPRPIIRGQRGQRVLLLRDGLRVNSSRRQSDFGELPALTDLSALERVEVVRGPSSVLYGSDAIGGVMNLITRQPQRAMPEGEVDGYASYRYDTASRGQKGALSLAFRQGKAGFLVEGSYRDAEPYDAPAGRFGEIVLPGGVPVQDSGVQDDSWRAVLSYGLGEKHVLAFEAQRYQAKDAGFGFIEPDLLDPGSARVRILYPDQVFEQFTVRHEAENLTGGPANRVRTSLFVRSNERRFGFDLFVPFGIPGLPEAGVSIQTENFTDIDTIGLRSEAAKVAGSSHLFTYGIDYIHDDSFNTDRSVTTVVGFGPPMPEIDTTPSLPNASYESLGLFAQDEIRLAERYTLIAGARYTRSEARTKRTPGLDTPPMKSTDDAVVGALNFIVRASPHLKVIANVGRAFRSPNLIERFFSGPTPEGQGFQSSNPGLDPETSLNVDLGVKYRRRDAYFELVAFRNTVRDGIRVAATGGTVSGLPEFRNVNVDKLRYEGIEGSLDWTWRRRFSIGASFTHLTGKNVHDRNVPVSDSYSDKLTLRARYDDPRRRYFVEYALRHNGEQEDVSVGDSPVGPVFPAFTVHALRGGATLYEARGLAQRIVLAVENLTDELYSEASNTSFFRPEPGRTYRLDWRLDF